MKSKIYVLVIFGALLLAGCSAQNRLSSRISGEWNIEKYESLSTGGAKSSIENAGSISFNSNGRGSQSFTTAIAHAGTSSSNEFRWENTAHTISIKSQEAQYPKAWIVVESGKSKQLWISTDNEGNVQMMHLRKK